MSAMMTYQVHRVPSSVRCRRKNPAVGRQRQRRHRPSSHHRWFPTGWLRTQTPPRGLCGRWARLADVFVLALKYLEF